MLRPDASVVDPNNGQTAAPTRGRCAAPSTSTRATHVATQRPKRAAETKGLLVVVCVVVLADAMVESHGTHMARDVDWSRMPAALSALASRVREPRKKAREKGGCD